MLSNVQSLDNGVGIVFLVWLLTWLCSYGRICTCSLFHCLIKLCLPPEHLMNNSFCQLIVSVETIRYQYDWDNVHYMNDIIIHDQLVNALFVTSTIASIT